MCSKKQPSKGRSAERIHDEFLVLRSQDGEQTAFQELTGRAWGVHA